MHIRAENLVKTFETVKALDGVSLELAPGQIVAVLGANGAGKTTLLEALSGNFALDAGQIYMDGELYGQTSDRLRRRFAFIPDFPPVPSYWSPVRFIATLLKAYRLPNEDLDTRVCEILDRMDILGVARWQFAHLSRGQAYKAILAGYLAADPEVWFVDEPFSSGMDARGLNCFKDYCREAVTRGRTIVFTTQIVELAEQFAHRVCLLDRGHLRLDVPVGRLHESKEFAVLVGRLREAPGA